MCPLYFFTDKNQKEFATIIRANIENNMTQLKYTFRVDGLVFGEKTHTVDFYIIGANGNITTGKTERDLSFERIDPYIEPTCEKNSETFEMTTVILIAVIVIPVFISSIGIMFSLIVLFCHRRKKMKVADPLVDAEWATSM